MYNEPTRKELSIDSSLEDRANMRMLEQFYTDGQIDNLNEELEKEKERLVNEMVEYAKKNEKAIKFSKDGDELIWEVFHNPKAISQKFFKPIIKLNGIEPIYNAEKLGMVFEFYNYLVAEVNDKIGNYPSSIKGFCRFAGITSTTLKKYRNSEDVSMRIVVEKIFDEIEEDNISMAQMGLIKEKTTQFKMRSQNEVVEKTTPTFNINITEKPDMDYINKKISKYIEFVEDDGE